RPGRGARWMGGARLARPWTAGPQALAGGSGKVQDALDLDLRTARQRRDADHRARRVGLGAVARHDLVHLAEVREVDELDIHLDGLGDGAAGGFRHGVWMVWRLM